MNTSCQKLSSEGAVDYRRCVYPVPHVSLTIDDAQPVEGGIKQLLKHIRPDWPAERIKFKVGFIISITIYFVIFNLIAGRFGSV